VTFELEVPMLLLLLACTTTEPDPTDSGDPVDSGELDSGDSGEAPTPRLWVSGYTSKDIAILDPETGDKLDTIAPVPGAQSVRPASEGWLIVAEEDGEVLRWDGALSPFLSGLSNPTAAVEADGEVLVAGFASDDVQRYGLDGSPLGALATDLDGPDAGMVVGPDGLLYVPVFYGDNIVTIDLSDGTVSVFADDVRRARGLAFGDDVLYATSWGTGEVRRYALDGTRGEDVATVLGAAGLALEPDGRALWVTSDQADEVVRLDATTGEELARYAAGVEGATFVTWMIEP
jgi:streptogramin lyase